MILLHGILNVLNLWDIDHNKDLSNEGIQKNIPGRNSTMPAARPLKRKMRIDSLSM
jgi:hypothetical protein